MAGGGSISVKTANVELDAAYAAQHVDVIARTVRPAGDRRTPAEAWTQRLGIASSTRSSRRRQSKAPASGSRPCYGIVKQSGGHIVLESEPGVGTTFTIHFPRPASPHRDAARRLEAGVARRDGDDPPRGGRRRRSPPRRAHVAVARLPRHRSEQRPPGVADGRRDGGVRSPAHRCRHAGNERPPTRGDAPCRAPDAQSSSRRGIRPTR